MNIKRIILTILAILALTPYTAYSASLDELSITTDASYTSISYLFRKENKLVGQISYTALPLLNVIVINLLRIESDYRKQGYGKIIGSYLLDQIKEAYPNNNYVFWIAQSLDEHAMSNQELRNIYRNNKGRLLISFGSNLPAIFCKRIRKSVLTNYPPCIIDSDGNPRLISKF